MHRLGLLTFVTLAVAACTERYDPNPLSGTWRVDRTVHDTGDCSPLMLPLLMVILRPGYEHEIDLGAQESGGADNVIAGNHISFTTSELIDGRTLVIKHELEIQIHEDLLLGSASAQDDGTPVGCQWDVVASHTSL